MIKLPHTPTRLLPSTGATLCPISMVFLLAVQGVSWSAEPDLGSARRTPEKGTKAPFKELAALWREWSGLERMMRLYERVQFRRHEDILYDQSLSGQARLSKSLELWPYYVGLE